MFTKKMFGKNIEPNCNYCAHFYDGNERSFSCKKLRHAKRLNKCKYFIYDPLKRVPSTMPDLPKYNIEDFSL